MTKYRSRVIEMPYTYDVETDEWQPANEFKICDRVVVTRGKRKYDYATVCGGTFLVSGFKVRVMFDDGAEALLAQSSLKLAPEFTEGLVLTVISDVKALHSLVHQEMVRNGTE